PSTLSTRLATASSADRFSCFGSPMPRVRRTKTSLPHSSGSLAESDDRTDVGRQIRRFVRIESLCWGFNEKKDHQVPRTKNSGTVRPVGMRTEATQEPGWQRTQLLRFSQ